MAQPCLVLSQGGIWHESKKRSSQIAGFSTVNPAAAAIDIGATIHVAAVGPNRDKEPVRTSRTFTDDF